MCEGLIENIHVCEGLIENTHVCEGLIENTHVCEGLIENTHVCEGLIENTHVCEGLIENTHVCEGLPPSAGETRSSVDWVIHCAPCDRVWITMWSSVGRVIQRGPCELLVSLSFIAVFIFLTVSFPWKDNPSRWKWMPFQPSWHQGGNEGSNGDRETRVYCRWINQFTKASVCWW